MKRKKIILPVAGLVLALTCSLFAGIEQKEEKSFESSATQNGNL